jgi:transposase
MLDVMVEQQAGIPMRMQPLRGHRRDVQDLGQLVTAPMTPWQMTDGPLWFVADRALSSAEPLQKLAETRPKWSTRVPATWSEAQAV